MRIEIEKVSIQQLESAYAIQGFKAINALDGRYCFVYLYYYKDSLHSMNKTNIRSKLT